MGAVYGDGLCFEHPSRFGITLNECVGVIPDRCQAVGESGAILQPSDGTSWNIHPSPTRHSLYGIRKVRAAAASWRLAIAGTVIVRRHKLAFGRSGTKAPTYMTSRCQRVAKRGLQAKKFCIGAAAACGRP